MLRAVFIDENASTELLGVLGSLVDDKGKQLTVVTLPRDADLDAAQTYQSALHHGGRRIALTQCLSVVRDSQPRPLPVLRYEDEAELPLLLAARIAAPSSDNVRSALAFYLQAHHAIELSTLTTASSHHLAFRGLTWRAVAGEQLPDLSDVFLPLPVEGSASLRADGGIAKLTVGEPSPDELAEAESYFASLVHNGQVDTHTGRQHARATHEIVTDAKGKRRLVRMRSGA